MTSPDKAALAKALENLRKGIPGKTVPLEDELPEKLSQRLDLISDLERRLGVQPSLAEERGAEIETATQRIRQQTEQARATGRERGTELFGDLGRIQNKQQSVAKSPLARATKLAESRAMEGLTPQEEQVLRERQQREISTRTQTALRQQRAMASDAGMLGETRRAREASTLRESIRAERDLAAGLTAADIGLRREGMAQFGNMAAQLQSATTQQNVLGTEIQRLNLSQKLTERQRILQTELANVGLQQATESLGVQRTLQSIALDQSLASQQRAFGLQQQEIDKPAPEPAGGGKFAVCTEMHRQGEVSDFDYAGDIWASKLFIDENTRKGYHIWAVPLSRLMSKSKIVTRLLKPLVTAWIAQMNFLVGRSASYSIVGDLIFTVAKQFCTFIGRFVK